jgi:hypothetical protein
MKTNCKSLLVALFCAGATTTQAQVPLYSSLPSAPAVIFLDFDGHTVEGTVWNYDGAILCGASGLDNTKITNTFNRVAEDFRPFNINVTTDSTKFLAAPISKRIRVIVTISHEWYGSAGGVAFVGSFNWGDDTPCFVFSGLLNYNTKNISEAISHETGHTLGLYHQATYNASCVKTSDYNYGQGGGEIGWAPIMGVGYYQNLTLWYNGPNSFGCTSFQSDLDIITTSNGIGFRSDDYSSSFAAAANIPLVANQFTLNGIIEQNADLDMIKFTQPSYGRFQLNAVPYNVGTGNSGSNLDLQITLYNSAEVEMNVYNPGTLLSSVIDTILLPGTYYLKIEGRGNMFAPNYASLGSYSLEASFTAGTPLALRKLELQGEVVSDRHRLHWLIDADEAVTTQILEVSTNGRQFSPVTQTANELRSYSYKPNTTTTAQYRMNVTFDNGRQYYSNIVSLRSPGSGNRPKLISTLTTNQVQVASPGNYQYAVYEYSGRAVSSGQLANGLNTINTGTISRGMYFIRFSAGNEQWTDKFIKQ